MSSEAILVHLGLGSNLGDRKEFLSMACNYLSSQVITGFRASSIYESEPLLKMKQSKYFNMVVCGLTVLSPKDLLKKCQQIEISLGRIRREHWGSREIDIDILSYGNRTINKDNIWDEEIYITNDRYEEAINLALSGEIEIKNSNY